MDAPQRSVVTGAFGYTGKYLTQRLLDRGEEVTTLTSHPERPNSFGDRLSVAGYDFDDPSRLAGTLTGATTLYNTYWVRFNHGATTYDQAVQNTKILFDAARRAGVRRIVHVSITNPSLDSPLPYFRGKAVLEQALQETGVSYAIVRPTVIFGREDILINNIAWFLRTYPVFAVPGKGDCKLQPIYVEDMADILVAAGSSNEDSIIDAVGPDIFSYDELVRRVAAAIGSRAKIVHLPPGLALWLSGILGRFLKDVVLTRDELDGLMADLLVSPEPPRGGTHLTDWLERNASSVGCEYHSELARHFRRS